MVIGYYAEQWLVCFRVEWDEDMLANPILKEVKDPNGVVVLKGMSAAVGICHGPVIKVCPHSTTGERKFAFLSYTEQCSSPSGQVENWTLSLLRFIGKC